MKEITDPAVAVLTESLTNVGRHAQADRAEAGLLTDGREVRLTVTDNGVGIPPDGATLTWWAPVAGHGPAKIPLFCNGCLSGR